MKVANPIYDVVFKYLLDDNRAAIILISNILNKKVNSLEMASQEVPLELSPRNIAVFRVDFKATITLDNGEQKVVLIEIQKAKFPSDILRFRRYLGAQYADKKNFISLGASTRAIPIFTIYFLGYPLDHYLGSPIVNITRRYYDNYTGKELEAKEYFVESLTHDSIVIQIPLFKNHKRNKLEKLMSLFEASTNHEVEVEEDEDEDYTLVARRLLRANSDEGIRSIMDVEDELLEALADLERKADLAEKQAQEAQKREELERIQKEEAQKREQEAQNAIKRIVKKMHERGFTIAEIAQDLEKTEAEVLALLS